MENRGSAKIEKMFATLAINSPSVVDCRKKKIHSRFWREIQIFKLAHIEQFSVFELWRQPKGHLKTFLGDLLVLMGCICHELSKIGKKKFLSRLFFSKMPILWFRYVGQKVPVWPKNPKKNFHEKIVQTLMFQGYGIEFFYKFIFHAENDRLRFFLYLLLVKILWIKKTKKMLRCFSM